MKNIVLKKSELAMLKGSGHTHEMVAEKFGVKESEIKDAMMTFGLSKAKPKAKKEPAYVIVLDDDMPAAPATKPSVNKDELRPVTENTSGASVDL